MRHASGRQRRQRGHGTSGARNWFNPCPGPMVAQRMCRLTRGDVHPFDAPIGYTGAREV